jgi:predicted RNase H-like nuclease (RuvC/YqgF family)
VIKQDMVLSREQENQHTFNAKKELEEKAKEVYNLKIENEKLSKELQVLEDQLSCFILKKGQLSTSCINFEQRSSQMSTLKKENDKLKEELKSTKLQVLQSDIDIMVDSSAVSVLRKFLSKNKETNITAITLD